MVYAVLLVSCAPTAPGTNVLLPCPREAALGRRFGAFLRRPGFRVDLALVVAAGGFRTAARVLPDSAGSKAAVG